MNPITFNDKFARAIAEHPDPAFMRGCFPQWQSAPLFDYETTWVKEIALLRSGMTLAEAFDQPWPFDEFRMALTENDVPYKESVPGIALKRYKSHYVVSRKNGEFNALICWRDDTQQLVVHVFTHSAKPDGSRDTGACLYLAKRGGWVTKVLPHHMVEDMCGSGLASLSSFILDCSAPTNHIVQVQPNEPSRSVQWLQARTHYTLISHGHPANKKEVQAGACVAVNRTEELQRMAHDRRGHWRTYKHERYTYARGKTRWIKQTWCGPKEWRDAGGKQIYRILEPVEGTAHAA